MPRTSIEQPPQSHSDDGVLRVLIVDDHATMRRGLSKLLNEFDDLAVVGQCNNGCEALLRVQSLRPHVILMDIAMPIMDGIEATRIIREQSTEVRIIGFTVHDVGSRADQMLTAGAEICLSKLGPLEALLAAISGKPHLTPQDDDDLVNGAGKLTVRP